MSGGITQLVAIGAQDAHLVGDPQVSFFRSNYKRHTNFAHVIERSTIQGNPSQSGMSSVRFERKGDLLGYVYITAVNTGASPNPSIAVTEADIDKIEFLIGGQVIDTQDAIYSLNIGARLGTSAAGKASIDTTSATGMNNLVYPLHFSFCENWQSAIPMVALQYHDVEIRIRWASAAPVANRRYSVHSSFIYLDTAEREELSNTPQDMLITQVQKAITSGSKVQELNFNHPVKFLAAYRNIVDTPPSDKLRLQVNGVDVGEERVYEPHFNSAPYYFHCPFALPDGLTGTPGDGFLYPFCLETNKLQPTGTLNFSRLDSARLITDSTNGILAADTGSDIYGVNYNILRIQNGMGGLMYAN
ncbi:hypothetical protein N9C10_01435 [Flavobacteriaceae bacterium]|nr:hypothetical protein [Flavobacteriaceae bacterium]